MASLQELQDIANILRRDSLVSTTSAGSGHPTSCLSAAELMACLFFSEMKYDASDHQNPNNDEFILSKGHAAPILYASLYRAGCISHVLRELRKLNSPLEGHPMPKSLPWVKVATGSLGQGLSVGLGMALASKMQKRDFRAFVLLGDSELSEGSVYEALQLGSHYALNNIVAVADINRLGQRGQTMLGHEVKKYASRFNSFGWDVITIDGHNVKQILSALAKSRESARPTLILARTFKGRGVSFLQDKEGWHGKPLDKEQLKKALQEVPAPHMPKIRIEKPKKLKGKNFKTRKIDMPEYQKGDMIATRDAYGSSLAALAEARKDVIAVDAEVSNSTRSGFVKKKTPEQFIESFIAEQNMIGIALGLSKKGFKVFSSTFAAFLSRAHDQIRMAALSSPSFVISGSHAGVSIGEDGASQMGLEDLAMFRDLPGSTVFYPSDAVSASRLVASALDDEGVTYIRTTRGKTPVIYKATDSFKTGDFKVLKQGKKDAAVLVGSGITLHEALKAQEELKKQGMETAVVDIYCLKPFDGKKFVNFAKNHGNKVVVAEDHYRAGGIGEMLASVVANQGILLKSLAVEGIPHSGKPEELLQQHGISWHHFIEAARS